ncbi:hypothetical protein II810_03700, partial [bacterium]|nr:hypothetical protein [bacterium]
MVNKRTSVLKTLTIVVMMSCVTLSVYAEDKAIQNNEISQDKKEVSKVEDYVNNTVSVNKKIVPENVRQFINESYNGVDYRFDGSIILPDNTVYIPLLPAKIIEPEKIQIVEAYPKGKTLLDKPNIVILNNDFVLLKILTDTKGQKTIYRMANPPQQLRTGMLPSNLFVPAGFVIPENLKSIIGNLNIPTTSDQTIRVENKKPAIS